MIFKKNNRYFFKLLVRLFIYAFHESKVRNLFHLEHILVAKNVCPFIILFLILTHSSWVVVLYFVLRQHNLDLVNG